MHKNILQDSQREVLEILKNFSNDFILVGETAIALQIGHRQSMDFDLASFNYFDNAKIRNKIISNFKIEQVIRDTKEEYTVLVNSVKFTFFYYPFNIKGTVKLDDIINMPDIETLAAMKAYTLGRRAKWKDYVDLYFMLDKYIDINKIIKKAQNLFGDEFNEKNFRAQLTYFKDIDYSENLIYKFGFEVDDDVIKKALSQASII